MSSVIEVQVFNYLPEVLNNRDPAPENRTFQIVDTGPRYSIRLNFQLASNSWNGSNQNTISYVQHANPVEVLP
eukprot:scaffold13221_cov123-Skeletonema_dohrnii-CCMP3373.AAC.11